MAFHSNKVGGVSDYHREPSEKRRVLEPRKRSSGFHPKMWKWTSSISVAHSDILSLKFNAV